ncbi:MAG: hypothetical protein KAT35_03280, partial [Candidatus Aenigmarchaeota archaeon]|nr:hypothetical protein [Candidatus Aenigmarchaeota archaeon]
MALLSRDNLMKAGVLFIVFAFMFEIFAFGGGGQPEPEIPDGNGGTGEPITGIALVDGTVLSYGREIVVFDVDEDAQAVIALLEDEGVVQYTAPAPGGATVLNLVRNANVSDIAERFEGTNASLVARARLKMPVLINFTTNQGQMSAVFQDITTDMEPDVPIGSNVSIRLTATMVDGLVTSYLAEAVSIEISFSAKARVLDYEPTHFVRVTVPWEERLFEDAAVREEFMGRYPNSTLLLNRNSSVLVLLEGAEFEQGYVLVAEPGML